MLNPRMIFSRAPWPSLSSRPSSAVLCMATASRFTSSWFQRTSLRVEEGSSILPSTAWSKTAGSPLHGASRRIIGALAITS